MEIRVPKFKPEEHPLANSIVVAIGASQTGKSTVLRRMGLKETELPDFRAICYRKPCSYVPEALGVDVLSSIPPKMQQNIDYIVICGIPSEREVTRIWERYSHLLSTGYSRETFCTIVKRTTRNWSRTVIDVSLPVRQGVQDAKIYWLPPIQMLNTQEENENDMAL